jgi:hypothetical protein
MSMELIFQSNPAGNVIAWMNNMIYTSNWYKVVQKESVRFGEWLRGCS